MKTLAQCWGEFEREVIPASAPAVQRREMRRAFYAGAFMMLNLVSDAGDLESEEEGAAALDTLVDEIKTFTDSIGAGLN